MSSQQYREQWMADAMSPAYMQEEEIPSKADSDAYYDTSRATVQMDTQAGLEPNKAAVARLLVEPLLRGELTGVDYQVKADLVYYLARQHKVPGFGGTVPEAWLTPLYTEQVIEMAKALVDRSA